MSQKTVVSVLVLIIIVLVGAVGFLLGRSEPVSAPTTGDGQPTPQPGLDGDVMPPGEDGENEPDLPPATAEPRSDEGEACQSTLDCKGGLYCAKTGAESCSTTAVGFCKAMPEACVKIYMPVCGCNGTTYGNTCEAASAGVNVRRDGAC